MQAFYNIYEKRKKEEERLFQKDIFEGISFTTLSKENRVYLQVVYICYNVPWRTIKLLMMPFYGEHGFAKATSKLIKEGWLYKEKIGGENVLALTRKTMQVVHPEMSNVEKVSIKEGSLGFNKARSMLIASYILARYRQFLILSFNSLSKEERHEYIKNQYIIYIQYRKFVELNSKEKEKFIKEWGLTEQEKELLTLGKVQRMNVKAIKLFVNKYSFSTNQDYLDFLKVYKEKLNTIECFYLLRDLKLNYKKTFDMLQVLNEMPSNFVEIGFKDKFFNLFLSTHLNVQVCKAECVHEKLTGVKQIIEGCLRRNLQQLKEEVENKSAMQENQKTESVLNRKSSLEACLKKVSQQLEEVYRTKLLIVNDEQGKKLQVSFDRLKQNGIFIKNFRLKGSEAYIEWVILDNVSDGLKGNLIAHRVFMLDSFMSILFKLGAQVTYSVRVATYSLERKELLNKEVVQTKKKLQGFKGQFALLEIEIFEPIQDLEAKYTFWQNFITIL